MFIEVTRVYRQNEFEHKMLLNVKTIMKCEPVDWHDYNGSCRIVLDRKDEKGEYIILYTKELYSQVAYRIKVIFNPPTKRNKKLESQ